MLFPAFGQGPVDGFTESGLVGYRVWSNVAPWMVVGMAPEDRGLSATLELHCPGAVEMKLTGAASFADLPWRPFERKVKWSFPSGLERATVRVVFREKRPVDGAARVTRPLLRLVDLRDGDRVLTGDGEAAWMDWTAGVLHATGRGRRGGELRHDSGEGRAAAEKEMKRLLGESIRGLPVESGVPFEALHLPMGRLGEFLVDFLAQVHLDEVGFSATGDTLVRGSLPLHGGGRVPILKATAALLRSPEPVLLPASGLAPESLLVVDARSLRFEPCLCPRLVSENDEVLLAPGRGVGWERPFVRYLHAPGARALTALGVETGLKGAPLFIRALGRSTGNPSSLVVSQRYREQILSSGAQHGRWQNGAWVILCD